MNLYWLECYHINSYFSRKRPDIQSIGRDPIKDYQEKARIYLDEYEVEEVDLRVNFDTSLLMKRFMVKE